jgi:putative membrane protein
MYTRMPLFVTIAAFSAFVVLAPSSSARRRVGAASKVTAATKFMKEAAQGGLAEVQLGQLAAQKADSADVKAFGQRMVDDHSKANDELKQLASDKGVTLPTRIPSKEQKLMGRLQGLSGPAFDKAYMEAMVKDHEHDVNAFRAASQNGPDTDVKAWAAKTLPTLQEHLQMARQTAQKVEAALAGGGTGHHSKTSSHLRSSHSTAH